MRTVRRKALIGITYFGFTTAIAGATFAQEHGRMTPPPVVSGPWGNVLSNGFATSNDSGLGLVLGPVTLPTAGDATPENTPEMQNQLCLYATGDAFRSLPEDLQRKCFRYRARNGSKVRPMYDLADLKTSAARSGELDGDKTGDPRTMAPHPFDAFDGSRVGDISRSNPVYYPPQDRLRWIPISTSPSQLPKPATSASLADRTSSVSPVYLPGFDPRITSCQDYVDKRYGDYVAFQRGAAACGDDAACIQALAYAGGAGVKAIAYDGRLLAQDGAPMPVQLPLAYGSSPKNEFFAPELLTFLDSGTPSRFLGRQAEIDAVRQAIQQNRAAVYIGSRFVVGGRGSAAANAKLSFASEWDFHKWMKERGTAGVSVNGFLEYEKRRERIARAVKNVQTAKRENTLCTARAAGRTIPVPTWSEMLKGVHPFGDDPRGAATSSLLQGVGAGSDLPELGGTFGIGGALGQDGTPFPGGVDGPGLPSGRISMGRAQFRPTGDMCDGTAIAFQSATDEAIEILLREYERAQAGEGGCMDPSSTECDWSPKDFVARFGNALSMERQTDYQECMNLTTPSTFMSARPELASQTALKKHFVDYLQRQAEAKDALKKVPRFKTLKDDHYQFGSSLNGSQWLGDKGSFAAGFDYDFTWGATPTRMDPASSTVCDFDAKTRAMFHAGVMLPSEVSDAFELYEDFESLKDTVSVEGAKTLAKQAFDRTGVSIDASDKKHLKLAGGGGGALVRALKNVVYTDTAVTVTGGKDATPNRPATSSAYTFGSTLVLLGQEIYNEPTRAGQADVPFNLSPGAGDASLAGVEKTFFVGPVPITVQANAEVHYGMDIVGAVGVPGGACGPDKPLFRAEITGTPWIYVDAVGSAGIGVDGFEVGVRGRVQLIRGDLPVKATLGVIGYAKNREIDGKLKFDMNGRLMLHALSGSMSVFAEALVEDWEHEIFRWRGVEQPLAPWNTQAEVPLPGFTL